MTRWTARLRKLATARLGRCLLTTGVICLSLWLGRDRMADLLLRRLALPSAERLAPGLRLDFKAVHTNLASRLEIDGLSVSYQPCRKDEGLRLAVPALKIGYSLSGLLPWPGPNAILSRLRLELARPSLTGRLPASEASFPLLLPTLTALPKVTAHDATLDLQLPGTIQVNAQGARLEIAASNDPGQKDGQRLQLLAPALSISGPAWPTLRGRLLANLIYGPGRLEVPELYLDDTLLISQGRLDTDALGMHFSLGLHLLRSQGLVEGSLDREAARLAFHLKDGDLAAALKDDGVRGKLKADGELTMRPGSPETLSGSVSALVRDGSWNGRQIERLELTAQAGGQRLTISRFELASGASHLLLQDARTPLSWRLNQGWRALIAKSRGRARLNLADAALLPAAWLAMLPGDWQTLGLKAAKADIDWDNGRLSIPSAEAWGGFGRVRLTDGRADLSGPFASWDQVPMRGDWQLDLADAGLVRRFWKYWPATGGEAHGQGSFSGTLAQPDLPLTATFLGPRLYGITLDKVAGRLVWSHDRLALDLSADNGPDNHLSYQGTIDLKQGALLDTKVGGRLAELKPYLPPSLTAGRQAAGSLSGEFTLSGPFASLTGKGRAAGDLTFAGVRLQGADFEGGFTGRDWDIQRLRAQVGPGIDLNLSSRVTAAPHGLRVELYRLDLDWQGQELKLAQAAELNLAANSLTVRKPLLLSGTLGQFRLEGGWGDGDRLRLTADQVRDAGLISRWSGKEIGLAGLDFTLTLTGSPTSPAWRWQGMARGLGPPGKSALSLSGPFDLAGDANGLVIRQCELAGDEGSIHLSGKLPVTITGGDKGVNELSPLALNARVDLPPGALLPGLFPEWLAKSGPVQANINLAGSLASPHGQIQFKAAGLSPGTRLALLPEGDFSANGLLEFDADRLTIPRLALSSPKLTLEAGGKLRQVSLAQLLKGGAWDEMPGQIEMAGKCRLPDLGWLASRWPGVRRVGGSLAAAFSLDGPLARPKITANLSLQDGAARGGDSLMVFRDLKLAADLKQDRLTVSAFSGLMGGAPVRGTGQIADLFSADPRLTARLTGHDLLLYRADGVKLRADTDLTLAGDLHRPELTGNLTLTDSRIDRRVDWLTLLKPGGQTRGGEGLRLFSFKDPPLSNVVLNLHLRAARPIEIANNVFRGGVRPDLILSGTGELPYLRGLIYADSGRLTLPPGRLDLTTGIIRFTEDDPDKPQLELQANGQLQGYQVTAQVSGPYTEPEVTLSSSPALASEDLMMLMLAGKRPVTAGQPSNSSGFSTAAVYLSRGLLSRLFSGAEVPSLLDHLEVDVGRAVTPQGDPTVDARVRLADGLANKDTSLYLTGEKDTWDYYDAGLRMVFRFR